MTFLYAATRNFDHSSTNNGMPWKDYIAWSKLTHLTELVSFDAMLNKSLVELDNKNPDDWNFIHCDGILQTDLYTSSEFVLKKMKATERFNFLCVVIEPDQDCKQIRVEGYEFVGYDLLDTDYSISALSNCGGFDETFLPTDLNDKGLIEDFASAYEIKKRLLENNPHEFHADTNVIAIWRHQTIGR